MRKEDSIPYLTKLPSLAELSIPSISATPLGSRSPKNRAPLNGYNPKSLSCQTLRVVAMIGGRK
jgi:hypothetical protein